MLLRKFETMLSIVNFNAAGCATRRLVAIGFGILLVAAAAVGDATAAVDCNPAPVHHRASAKHRSHHRRAKVHPRPGKRPRVAGAKRVAGQECRPVAVTLAEITALGSPDDIGLLAPIADLAPGADSGPPTDVQLVSFPLPPPSSVGGGGPGGGFPGSGGPGGGGPGSGGPGSGGPPGGGSYTPPPGGGGSPPGGGGFPGGSVPGVPEPATWMMMLVGVGAMGAIVRRRRGAARIDA